MYVHEHENVLSKDPIHLHKTFSYYNIFYETGKGREGENIIQDICVLEPFSWLSLISIMDLVLVYGLGIFELLREKFFY